MRLVNATTCDVSRPMMPARMTFGRAAGSSARAVPCTAMIDTKNRRARSRFVIMAAVVTGRGVTLH
jgi:hypothetical protein